MKTGIEQVEDIFGLLNIPAVTILLGSGHLTRFKRPYNSKECDIVVNSVSLSNRPLQQGTVNVNIHAPNAEKAKYNGVADDKQPDIPKLTELQNAIIPLLEAVYPADADFHADIETAPEIIQDRDGTWYVNIRVNYYSFTNNNQNI